MQRWAVGTLEVLSGTVPVLEKNVPIVLVSGTVLKNYFGTSSVGLLRTGTFRVKDAAANALFAAIMPQ